MKLKLWERERWKFRPAALLESGEPLPNPGRGWYQIYPITIGDPPDFSELFWCLDKEDTLALVLFDIGGCRERPLNEEELGQVKRALDFFVENHKQMILRVTYDREGRGPEKEPLFLSQIQTHMKQIGPLIVPYAKNVLVFQGLFIGSWGEMHSSRFLSENNLRSLYDTLKEALGGCCPIAVRKPSQLRQIFSEKALAKERIALYDDGLFASETHLGTFLEKDAGRGAWRAPWGAGEELEFVQNTPMGPNGGEAVLGEILPPAETVYRTMEQMQICYLNKTYHEQLIKEWKQLACGEKGPYSGHSVYTYIGCRLGYRFTAEQVCVTKEKGGPEKRSVWEICLHIKNTGFGRMFFKGTLWIVVRGQNWENRYPADARPEQWAAGEKCRAVIRLEREQLFGPLTESGEKEGPLKREARIFAALTQEDFSNRRPVRFANQGAGEELFLGTLTEG